MLLDHVGYYFYPDNDWYRVVGRGAMPIWAFLIGYAQSRDVSRRIWLWAGALLAATAVTGGSVLPLNILFTFIAVRLVLDRMAKMTFTSLEVMTFTLIAFGVCFIPTMLASEYGDTALLFALCGFAVRHSATLPVSVAVQRAFIIITCIFHALTQIILFNFDAWQGKGAAFVIGAVIFMMYFFKPKEYVTATEKLPSPITGMLQFAGRYTLEIYVIHLIIFKMIAAQYHLVDHGWFEFKLLP